MSLPIDPFLDASAGEEERLTVAMEGHQAGLWTAIPGTVVAVRRAGGLCRVDVRPGVQALLTPPGEAARWADLPVLADVPVLWQGGGGVTLTLPVAAGDEALVVFASRDTGGWMAAGGAGPPPSRRMHSLSDGFALVGLRSRPRPIANLSGTEAQLRADGGNSLIALNPATGAVRIVAPGGISMEGPVTINGSSFTHNGKNVGSTHRHTGVAAGGATSGEPA